MYMEWLLTVAYARKLMRLTVAHGDNEASRDHGHDDPLELMHTTVLKIPLPESSGWLHRHSLLSLGKMSID